MLSSFICRVIPPLSINGYKSKISYLQSKSKRGEKESEGQELSYIPLEGMRKLVEGRKNALYFAKSIAKATGMEAEYTRKRSFDDNYYKDLIIKALDQNEKLGRAQINELLLEKLPEALTEKQKETKIGNLLLALHKAGKIVLGEKKQWMLKSSHK